MATYRDGQDLRAAEGECSRRMTLARECRNAALHTDTALRVWWTHVEACPLGEDCEARA